MEILKSFLTAFPAWLSYIFMVVGVAVTALFAVRLGYGAVIAKTAYKWIEWAEVNIVGGKMGAEKKKLVIDTLREITPDWLDWAINEKTLDWIVEVVFKISKKKLAAYMEKKNRETTTVAHFGQAGEDGKKPGV
jgi:hypothetical protein|nr:MAG TPA: holin [Caudoviricetes sp.]